MLEVIRITTLGAPYYENENGPNLGYEVHENIIIVPSDYDGWNWENLAGLEVLATIDTLGM